MAKNQWTEADMVKAFLNWRDMFRQEGAQWLYVKQAWDAYTKIRDSLDWKPFPTRTVIANFKITKKDKS